MPSTSTSRTVTGLTNGTSYLFRVAGVNHTVGDYSGTASATPASTPASIVVTGGAYWWSGTYALDGESNGRPRYGFTYPGEQRNYIYWTGSDWRIGVPQFGIVHDNNATDSAMPPKTGWGSATLAY